MSHSPEASKPKSLLRSAGLVGVMTLISRLTGVVVQRVVGGYLGVGEISDAYQVAFRLPNMLRRFTAEGTMTAAFLPTLTDVETQQGEQAAKNFVADFLGSLGAVLLSICLLGMLFMTPITSLQMMGKLAPGAGVLEQFRIIGQILMGNVSLPPDVALCTALARIMFPYLLLVSLTAALAAVLNLRHRFALAASVSTFYNLTFLAASLSLLTFGPEHFRLPERAAVIFASSVLLAGLVQIAVILPSFKKLGFHFGFKARFNNPSVRLALKRMLPGILAGGIHPINVLVSQTLASQLEKGAQTVLVQSNILGELVLGLFAVSIATVSLPTLSRLASEGDLDGVRHNLASALRGTAFLALPGAAGMAVLAQPTVALIYQTGHFTAEAVAWTASTLQFQAFGILFIASSRISTQALNAMKDYRGPAQAAILGFGCNILFSILLMGPLGTQGMALANGLSALVTLLYLGWRLHRKLQALPYRPVLKSWAHFGLACALMAGVAFAGGTWLDVFNFHGFKNTALRLFPLIGVCAACYFALLWITQAPEATVMANTLKRKFKIGSRL